MNRRALLVAVTAGARNSGNLVLYDEATGSFWSQLLAQAICGLQTGEDLTLVPATVTSWSAWWSEYPETDVLLPPPYSRSCDCPRLAGRGCESQTP